MATKSELPDMEIVRLSDPIFPRPLVVRFKPRLIDGMLFGRSAECCFVPANDAVCKAAADLTQLREVNVQKGQKRKCETS